MTRKLVSVAELISILNDRIKRSDLLDGDCSECYISGFYRLAEPDADGCNWDLPSYTGPLECAGVIAAVIRPIRVLYNLSE